jgi:hypothetical protein
MRFALWAAVTVLALLWTGGAALVAELVDWAAREAASRGTDAVVASAAGAVTLPSWLSPWVDVSTWNAAVSAVGEAIRAAQTSLPSLGSMLGWLVPAVWVVWGLGLALLLALAAGGHWLVGRRR